MPKSPRGVALVTGAARRIGREIALDLAREGWTVAVHHNASHEAAIEVVERIGAAGGTAAAFEADLAESEQVAGLVPQIERTLGTVTCLVNNASLFEDDRIESLDEASWTRHQDINLKAPLMLASALAQGLTLAGPEAGQGNVVNIIDQRVLKPTPHFFSYTVSKAALWFATRTMAQGLAPRVRVNAIGPGPVLQSIHQSAEQFRRQCEATPLGRGTTPVEICAAIRFLLDAPAMTGQMMVLDGGQHLVWQTPDVVGVDL
ncbi:MAG: SDR family oxidoreductase [Rhizobiales bacterium]|nr:SDR family oxidoreductase [Hyphomicrobiales bacterium]